MQLARPSNVDMFGLTATEVDGAGAHWTAREIVQQPGIWVEVERLMAGQAKALVAFLAPLLASSDRRIVLTGAGTSAFVGQCLAPSMAARHTRRVEAIPTTDIVAGPGRWLARGTPTLLVSFARSGNSPESLAAVEFAEHCIEDCAQLIVTCNSDGALYRRAQTAARSYPVLLPELSNDRGFAMTSSFTGMLLAGAMAFGEIPADGSRTPLLGRLAPEVLPSLVPLLEELVRSAFERVVYLGSNVLEGLARESALKMLELTDGKVVAVADTPLGFRHGPKTILNGKSLVVMLLSNDPYVRRYELDLLNELRRDAVAPRVVSLSTSRVTGQHCDDILLAPAAHEATVSDLESCFPYVMFAQSLALLRSLSVGVRPDTPNAAGTVSRVVQGVSIHPWRGAQ